MLGPYSHQVSTRLLRLFSPWVFTLALSPWRFWVFTQPLWGWGILPTRHLFPPGTHWNWVLPNSLLLDDVGHLFVETCESWAYLMVQAGPLVFEVPRSLHIVSNASGRLSFVPWWLWPHWHFSQHASAVVSGLLPYWLRGGYSTLAIELICGLE